MLWIIIRILCKQMHGKEYEHASVVYNIYMMMMITRPLHAQSSTKYFLILPVNVFQASFELKHTLGLLWNVQPQIGPKHLLQKQILLQDQRKSKPVTNVWLLTMMVLTVNIRFTQYCYVFSLMKQQ